MRPRRLALVIAVSVAVVVSLLLAIGYAANWSRTSGAPVLPTDASEQVEWLGDIYATSLTAFSGEELSADLVAASRQDFTKRLRADLVEPLPATELWEVADWIFYVNSLCREWPVPPDLELKDRMGNTAHMIALYLQRPRLSPLERYPIQLQVGELMGYLHGALVKEFPELADPDSVIEGAAFVAMPILWDSLLSPVSPEVTRLFTPEEVEWLREQARDHAAGARQGVTTLRQDLAAQGVDISGLVEKTAEAEIMGAVLQFHSHMRGLQYTAPTVLTRQEEEANREAKLRRWELDPRGIVFEAPGEEIDEEGGEQ